MTLKRCDSIGYKHRPQSGTGAEPLIRLVEIVERWERGGEWFKAHGPYNEADPKHAQAERLMHDLLNMAHALYDEIEAQAPGDPEAKALLGRLWDMY